ncbi:MAG: hypothetical protein VB096_09640 [Pseudoflavonifractor sp.]|nr:hypothetical protein [Pseudoflavonifractor sp.]
MSVMQLLIATQDWSRSFDVTSLAESVAWAGSYDTVGRTVDFTLPVDDDGLLPVIPCPMGSHVQLLAGGSLRFDGTVFTRERTAGENLLSVGAVDRGINLKSCQGSYQFKGWTPEAIAGRVCTDYGIPAGNLAQTGVSVTRKFAGASLYQIIQTAYTLAAEQNGKRYQLRFRGSALDVVEKGLGAETLVLKPGSNLLSATSRESAESLINSVAVYDDNGQKVTTRRDSEAVGLYGLMESYLTKSKDRDTDKEARRLLVDNSMVQKVTVEAVGNPDLISGSGVIVREPVTGLWGKFWILSDSHTWKNGVYRTKLTLDFRNLMDKADAGSDVT